LTVGEIEKFIGKNNFTLLGQDSMPV